MEQVETKARTRVADYTAATFAALAAFFFFYFVSFIPDSPVLPLVLGLGLGVVSLRNRGASVAILYLLVFVTILWQMIGFGFFQLLRAGVGGAVLVAMAMPLPLFYSRRVELTSMSIAILCVALLFTPAYFVSVPLIAAVATVTGFASVEAISLTFILLAFPLLLLDNALYFVTTSQAVTPNVFGNLVYLSQYMRPPLPGLNVFLTALPVNLISPLAPQVSSFLTQNWDLFVIPLLLMGLIIFSASAVGSFTRRFLNRVAAARESRFLQNLGVPLAVSLAVPAAFLLLIVPLSFSGGGGFQTSLTNEQSYIQIALTLAASVILGLVFVARESLVQRLEGSEIGRGRILTYVKESKSAIDAAKEETTRIKSKVPSMSTVKEEHAISEGSAYVADVERRVATAGPETLAQWAAHLEKDLLPSLRDIKERLTMGVLNELATLRGVVDSVNAHLDEASVPMKYSVIPDVPPDAPLDMITDLYEVAVEKIEAETRALFEAYQVALDSAGRLLDLKDITIPVAPEVILQSNEYIQAMRLVSEEYWLGFHLRYAEEFRAVETDLAEKMRRFGPLFDLAKRSQVEETASYLDGAPPAEAQKVLHKTDEFRADLASLIGRLSAYPEVVSRAVEGLNPAAMGYLSLQSVRRSGELTTLKNELASLGHGLGSLAKFLQEAYPVVSGQSSMVKSDSDSLVVFAHYPEGRRAISRMVRATGSIRVDQFPYDKRASVLFFRLFAAENPGFKFDEANEVLSNAP